MELMHIDEKGNARMVDVSNKQQTAREAVAIGRVYMNADTIFRIMKGSIPKGDVLAVARVAGIMAAKRAYELIPMCHHIPLDSAAIEFMDDADTGCIKIRATVKCIWKTGVEMEALTAVSAAALTIYDMCKAVDKDMVIGDIKLVKKSGGKSGDILKQE